MDQPTSIRTTQERYPAAGVHTWQEFAGVAVEFGGYGDATLIDPWSGRRLHVPGAAAGTPTETMRRLADAADEVGFFQTEEG